MKDIVIIAHFTFIPGEAGNGRFIYIANELSKRGEQVEIVTSSFSHLEKRQRHIAEEETDSLPYKLTTLFEPGYKKNITIRRFYSHYILGCNLRKYLAERKQPDIIYCAIPSLDIAFEAAKYAEENKVEFIVDIQDLWPEAFKMVFNIPFISDVIFYPMKRKADYVYSRADKLIAVSQTYLERGLKNNTKCKEPQVVFLGTDLKYFDRCKEEHFVQREDDDFWIGYVGTLGNSYNIPIIIKAIAKLQEEGINNIKFIIMGDGPLRDSFERVARDYNVNCIFTGMLDYPFMVGMLCACDIAVNPIKKGSAGSIINKVGDYAMASLPVVNTQECQEYQNLVNTYNMGINCESENIYSVAIAIREFAKDGDKRNNVGKASRRLGEELFDRRKSYKHIISLFED